VRLAAYRSFLDQLATLLQSGLPILEALTMLEAGPDRQIGETAGRVLRRLGKGGGAGEAMAALPLDFPPAHAALVAAAEKAGAVPNALGRLRDEVDRRIAAWRALLARSAYPVLLLILTVILVPLYLFFQGKSGTYLAIQAAVFLPVGAGAALAYAYRGPAARFARRLPLLSGALRRAALGESLSLLGLLVEAGIGVREALEITAKAARAPELASGLRQAARSLEAGRNLSEALSALSDIPKLERGTIASGERAGAMDRALQSAGASLSESAQRRLGRLLIGLAGAIYLLAALTVFIVFLRFMLAYLGRLSGVE
jgi:type II secretory pathway component PulF